MQDMYIWKSTAKNPALKIFQCLQLSNFVNLRIYAVFHLWYNIQDLYIWKSTNQQQKNQALKNFQCLQFSNFVNLRIYVVFHLWYNKCFSFSNFSNSTQFSINSRIFRNCSFGYKKIIA